MNSFENMIKIGGVISFKKSKIIKTELPAFILKCLTLYNQLLEKDKEKDIWHLCPDYFLEQQVELKIERNPLFKYLLQNTRYKKDNVVLMEDVRICFSEWIGKNIKILDNGTFGQVNNEYILLKLKICKHCNTEAKKGCCINYNNKDRTVKKIIKNFEFINNTLSDF
jgi:hypothetical protein